MWLSARVYTLRLVMKNNAKTNSTEEEKPAFVEIAVLGEIDMGEKTLLKARVIKTDAGRFVDLRKFINNPPKYVGPGRQGVMIPLDQADELRDMLNECGDFAQYESKKKKEKRAAGKEELTKLKSATKAKSKK